MKNIYLICFLLINNFLMSNAQQVLRHEKKVYVSPDKKVYFNKDQPVYFRVSTSPDENAPSYLLPSEKSAKYANPMYFDSDGKNTLRSPSAVDPVTKKQVQPKQDVLFDMYADGKSPITQLQLNGAAKYSVQGKSFFGPGLKLNLLAKDEVSGVESSYISVNSAPYVEFSTVSNPFDEQKQYSISYYSVDNVGNAEPARTIVFQCDYTAPATSFKILGESKGNVLSSKASVSLMSVDTISGVKAIMYAINDAPARVYSTPIPLSVLKDGKSKIRYYAIDFVGNKEEEKVIAASTETVGENTEPATFSFYIDKEAPVISSKIVGDQFKGKYLYISARSKVQINATDEKSGVDKVLYSIDNNLLKENYNDPINIAKEGLHKVLYASSDNVGNFALAKSQQVFVDATNPASKVSFAGNVFKNRDTLFITSERTRLIFSATDAGSGLKEIRYTLDGKTPEIYSRPFSVAAEGFHTMQYAATDNVNNLEADNKSSFYIDNTPPLIHYQFSVKAIGEKTIRDEKYTIYPSNAMLYIAATDNNAGGEVVEYIVNGKKEKLNQIPLKNLAPGNYQVEVFASDVLKNRSTTTIRFSIED